MIHLVTARAAQHPVLDGSHQHALYGEELQTHLQEHRLKKNKEAKRRRLGVRQV